MFSCSENITVDIANIFGEAHAAVDGDNFIFCYDELNRVPAKVLTHLLNVYNDVYKNYMNFVPVFVTFNPAVKNKGL